MKTFRLKLFLTIITTIFLLLPNLASAAGLWLYEMGTPDSGMASAGRAALASDASTAGTNPAGRPDGQLKFDEDDIAFGFNLDILYEPILGTRFGLTYRSKVDLKFKDGAGSKGILPPLSRLTGKKIDLKLTVPQAAMFSVYHQLSKKLALTANLGWQEQSEFGNQAPWPAISRESLTLTMSMSLPLIWPGSFKKN